MCFRPLSNAVFQSTSSVWRTTGATGATGATGEISIHVLRVEDDGHSTSAILAAEGFQSTSSVWRTTPVGIRGGKADLFQSTSSVWRTTD